MVEGNVEWCKKCTRAVGIGCNCGMTFAERIRNIQVDEFGLLDKDRKLRHPDNKGLDRKYK